MVNTESIGLYIPELDDRSEEEIYQKALAVVSNRSRGLLNDFSDSGPLGVMLRAQAFASAELLYRVNRLPLAFALKLLELTDTRRKLGQKAQANLTFYLTAPQTSTYTIPKGFQVLGGSGSYEFYTDTALIIPSGSTSGTVSATAKEIGESYNLAAYTINQITQPLAFLASVINVEPAQGGAASEPVEETIDRGLKALRSRNPVSAIDFEQRAEDLLGAGSKAKAIGLLAADKITQQAGAVHLFLLAATGEPANPALINDVYAQMKPQIMLGTSLYISPMETLPIVGEAIVKLNEGGRADEIGEALWAEYKGYLSPDSYESGVTLLAQEMAFRLRFVSGIDFLDTLLLQGDILDVPMPNAYTLPVAHSLNVTMIDSEGNRFELLYGAGELP